MKSNLCLYGCDKETSKKLRKLEFDYRKGFISADTLKDELQKLVFEKFGKESDL